MTNLTKAKVAVNVLKFEDALNTWHTCTYLHLKAFQIIFEKTDVVYIWILTAELLAQEGFIGELFLFCLWI